MKKLVLLSCLIFAIGLTNNAVADPNFGAGSTHRYQKDTDVPAGSNARSCESYCAEAYAEQDECVGGWACNDTGNSGAFKWECVFFCGIKTIDSSVSSSLEELFGDSIPADALAGIYDFSPVEPSDLAPQPEGFIPEGAPEDYPY